MKNIFYLLTLIILAGGFIPSCKDDNCSDEDPPVITFSESAVEVESKGRYCTITVNAPGSVTVSCASDWIELENVTVQNEEQIVFYVADNEDKNSRNTVIQVTTVKTPAATAELTVTQSGVDYDGGNDVASKSLSKDFRVGWGYNICMDFMSDKSVTSNILDYDKLIAIERKYGDPIIGEANRSIEQMDTYTAYSLAEMARQLTSVQDTESSFFGLAKTVTRHVKITKDNFRESQVYGYVRASKIIATRYIDEGKLDDLVKDGADIFSPEFDNMRRLVLKDPTDNNINKLIDRFGTNLVILADIGGAIDYSINFTASKVTNLEQSVTSRVQYVLGKKTADSQTQAEASSQSSVINSELAITVMGGNKEIVNLLKNSISQLNEYSQLDVKLLSNWMNSLDVDYRDANKCKNLTVVKCKTLPIWDVFTDENVRNKLKAIIIERVNKASISWNVEDFGITQAFEIPITDNMLLFDPSHEFSLVRVGYINKEPKVEICNEYVSEIRVDQRITVLYPIQFGMSNIRRGIFPGDENHLPAYVTSTPDGKAYVRPIKGYGGNGPKKMNKVYYLGGSLYPEPNGVKMKPVTLTIERAGISLMDMHSTIWYPIVKIGNGYWTRTYIRTLLGFVKEIGGTYYSRERILNKLLYANYFYNINPKINYNNEIFGTNDGLWYLPNNDDLTNLLTTIGNNPKALFMGQVSGFDAEFKGYFGNYDVHSGLTMDGYKLRDEKFSFIGFKNNLDEGSVLAIGADYSLKSIPAKMGHDNDYPIRLFRKSNFIYRKIDN